MNVMLQFQHRNAKMCFWKLLITFGFGFDGTLIYWPLNISMTLYNIRITKLL